MEVNYTEGVDGNNLLILKREDVALITDLLLGGDGKIDPSTVVMDELHLSAIQEVMNQMVGSSATSLSELVNDTVNISTPHAKELVISDSPISEVFSDPDQLILKISFKMGCGGALVSEIMQILPIPFAKDLARRILQNLTGGTEPLAPIEDHPIEKKPGKCSRSASDTLGEQPRPAAQTSAPQTEPTVQPQYAAPQPEAPQPQYPPPVQSQYAPPMQPRCS